MLNTFKILNFAFLSNISKVGVRFDAVCYFGLWALNRIKSSFCAWIWSGLIYCFEKGCNCIKCFFLFASWAFSFMWKQFRNSRSHIMTPLTNVAIAAKRWTYRKGNWLWNFELMLRFFLSVFTLVFSWHFCHMYLCFKATMETDCNYTTLFRISTIAVHHIILHWRQNC